MKTLIIIAVAVMVGLATFGAFLGKDIVVKNERVATTTVEVVPDWAEDPDAVEAAQAVIRRKELETELSTVNEEINTLETRREALEKELGTY